MDSLDRTIIEILQGDGRASHAKMAGSLRVSKSTVSRRLSKLLQDRVIRVVAVAEPEQLGYHTSAFIGLQVDPARVETVASELAALPETEHVAIPTGSYDIFIWVNLESSEALAAFLHHKVGTVKGVRQTETFVSLETRKPMTLGRRIKELRRTRGLKAVQLAELAGISRSYVRRMEADRVNLPGRRVLWALAEALASTPNDLLAAAGYLRPEIPRLRDPGLETAFRYTESLPEGLQREVLDFVAHVSRQRGSSMSEGDQATPRAELTTSAAEAQ